MVTYQYNILSENGPKIFVVVLHGIEHDCSNGCIFEAQCAGIKKGHSGPEALFIDSDDLAVGEGVCALEGLGRFGKSFVFISPIGNVAERFLDATDVFVSHASVELVATFR